MKPAISLQGSFALLRKIKKREEEGGQRVRVSRDRAFEHLAQKDSQPMVCPS